VPPRNRVRTVTPCRGHHEAAEHARGVPLSLRAIQRSVAHSLESVQDAADRLRSVGYLPSPEIASSAFLADRLEKPILVEGPAGVGKTELARALAQATGRTFLRLQCYEGLDESKALYEWEYAKQLLYTQLLKDKIAE